MSHVELAQTGKSVAAAWQSCSVCVKINLALNFENLYGRGWGRREEGKRHTIRTAVLNRIRDEGRLPGGTAVEQGIAILACYGRKGRAAGGL